GEAPLLVLMNASTTDVEFVLASPPGASTWTVLVDTMEADPSPALAQTLTPGSAYALPARTLAVLEARPRDACERRAFRSSAALRSRADRRWQCSLSLVGPRSARGRALGRGSGHAPAHAARRGWMVRTRNRHHRSRRPLPLRTVRRHEGPRSGVPRPGRRRSRPQPCHRPPVLSLASPAVAGPALARSSVVRGTRRHRIARRHLGGAAPPPRALGGHRVHSHRTDAACGIFRDTWLDRKEHTSELQSRENLVCRLLLEKKKRTERNT